MLLLIIPAYAASQDAPDIYAFQTVLQQQQFQQLLGKLRCLVCQNQNLADSNASLAQDLRRIVYKMVLQKASDQEIIDYLTARYGDFILFQPPIKKITYALWFGPFLLFMGAIMLLLQIIYRKGNQGKSAI